jgi:hypothetical protein
LILNEAEAVLDPVADIDGFLLCCLVDASTGMILASRKDQDDISMPTAVTFRSQLYVIRLMSEDPDPNILLLVILDRTRANLALARREIRNFCVNFAA